MKETTGAPFRHSGENRNPGVYCRQRGMTLDSGFRRSDVADEASDEFDSHFLELFLRSTQLYGQLLHGFC
jgi:hypothetical protein